MYGFLDRYRRFDNIARVEPVFGAATTGLERPDTWFKEWALGGDVSAAGKNVSPKSAMRISAVHAAVELRSGTLAQLPLIVYRRSGDDRETDETHPLYRILHDQPNAWQTAFDFVQMQQMHLDLRGNAFARIHRDFAGRITALEPLHPDSVAMLQTKSGEIFYDWHRPQNLGRIRLPQREVFHLRGKSEDGLLGMSRVALARERLGISLASEEYSAKFFANNARPSVVLTAKGSLSDVARENMAKSWREAYAGSSNAHKTALLEEDVSVQTLSSSNVDAQFLELMQFGVKDIARFFDVPSFLIGDDSKNATYASAEQSVSMFEKFTMVEIAKNWEQSIRRDLLREDEKEEWFAEFSMQALLRGDFATRMDGYNKAVGRPIMTVNEARKRENLPATPDGDKLYYPVNMAPEGSPPPGKQPANPAPQNDEDDEE